MAGMTGADEGKQALDDSFEAFQEWRTRSGWRTAPAKTFVELMLFSGLLFSVSYAAATFLLKPILLALFDWPSEG